MSIGYYEPVKRNEATVCMLIRNDNQEIFSGKKKTNVQDTIHHIHPSWLSRIYLYVYVYMLYI